MNKNIIFTIAKQLQPIIYNQNIEKNHLKFRCVVQVSIWCKHAMTCLQ